MRRFLAATGKVRARGVSRTLEGNGIPARLQASRRGLMLVPRPGDSAHPPSAERLVLQNDGSFPGLPPSLGLPDQGPPRRGSACPVAVRCPSPPCQRHHIPPPGIASHHLVGQGTGRPPGRAVLGQFRWLTKESVKKHNKTSNLISTNPYLH